MFCFFVFGGKFFNLGHNIKISYPVDLDSIRIIDIVFLTPSPIAGQTGSPVTLAIR